MFGIAGLGVAQALAEPELGTGLAKTVGALAFAISVVFLVVGRAELFSENFFGPVAAAIDGGRRSGYFRLLRLWANILILNFVGGAVLAAVLIVDGALPTGAPEALIKVAEEIAARLRQQPWRGPCWQELA